MIRIWPHRTYGVVILFLLVSFLHYYFWHVDNAVVVLSSSETTAKEQQPEFVATYTFPPPPEKLNARDNDVLIPHLTPVNPSTLIPNGSYPIDLAHRRGYLHTGNCLFIMDASGLLLFLKRSSDVVTCPSTWSILGEHSIANEEARDTVVRGMEEELGLKQQQVVRREANDDDYYGEIDSSSSSFTAEFQTIDKNIIHVAIQNITQYPLYYIRHYGPRLDNRIDSQVTYLWVARLPKRHEEIHIKLDEEVADHKWISLEEFSNWIEADAARDNYDREVNQHPLDGIQDDGPPNGDFCHHTIRSLYAKGLDHLKLMLL